MYMAGRLLLNRSNVFGDKTQGRVVTLQTPIQQLVAEIHGQCAGVPRIGSVVQAYKAV